MVCINICCQDRFGLSYSYSHNIDMSTGLEIKQRTMSTLMEWLPYLASSNVEWLVLPCQPMQSG